MLLSAAMGFISRSNKKKLFFPWIYLRAVEKSIHEKSRLIWLLRGALHIKSVQEASTKGFVKKIIFFFKLYQFNLRLKNVKKKI